MLCENCNIREATVHKTKITNGVKEEIHLCEECAKKDEIFSFNDSLSIHNFLSSILEGSIAPNITISDGQIKKCPQCGSSYNDFRQGGRLGCNMCYSTFNDMLIPLIKRVQGNSVHAGKIPKKSGHSIRLRRKIRDLKNQLHQLVETEAFEEAARVRDEIKKLEEETNN
ncbi:MAG TPA: UvrB/UvrC motif-containing protein [Oscillospiraceae bacterium]|nr:UvrB/UvrC motif-containing protein [Oscillospiraceae bacterium]